MLTLWPLILVVLDTLVGLSFFCRLRTVRIRDREIEEISPYFLIFSETTLSYRGRPYQTHDATQIASQQS